MIRPLALFAALLLAVPASAQTADVYVVQAGDTLFRISRAHGLTVEELQALNGLEGNAIEVGQRLRLSDRVPMPSSDPVVIAPPEATVPDTPASGTQIEPTPTTEPESAPASGPAVHTVAAGETLFRIALRYDTTVEELRRINDVEGDRIEVGQRLRLPGGGSATPPSARPAPGPVRLAAPERPWEITNTTLPADLVHFVEPGETLYSIAAALGLRVDALTAANALSTAPLVPGTPLYLPGPVDPANAIRGALPAPEADGLALVFPSVMAGRATASGEPYDPEAFTASHREAPLGSVILVTNPATGRSTFVRVIDRGPVSRAYLVELSAAAADLLGLDADAAGAVEIRRVP